MNVHMLHSHASSKVAEVVVERPLISDDERALLQGTLSAEDYIKRGQRLVVEDLSKSAHRNNGYYRKAVLLFMSVVSFAYAATATIFVLTNHVSAAVAASTLSVSFIAAMNLISRLRSQRW